MNIDAELRRNRAVCAAVLGMAPPSGQEAPAPPMPAHAALLHDSWDGPPPLPAAEATVRAEIHTLWRHPAPSAPEREQPLPGGTATHAYPAPRGEDPLGADGADALLAELVRRAEIEARLRPRALDEDVAL